MVDHQSTPQITPSLVNAARTENPTPPASDTKLGDGARGLHTTADTRQDTAARNRSDGSEDVSGSAGSGGSATGTTPGRSEAERVGGSVSTSQHGDSPGSELHGRFPDTYQQGSEAEGNLLRIAVCRQSPPEGHPSSAAAAADKPSKGGSHAESPGGSSTYEQGAGRDGSPNGASSKPRRETEGTRVREDYFADLKSFSGSDDSLSSVPHDNRSSAVKEDDTKDVPTSELASRRLDLENDDLLLPDLPSMPAGGFDDWTVAGPGGTFSLTDHTAPAGPDSRRHQGQGFNPWLLMGDQHNRGAPGAAMGDDRGRGQPVSVRGGTGSGASFSKGRSEAEGRGGEPSSSLAQLSMWGGGGGRRSGPQSGWPAEMKDMDQPSSAQQDEQHTIVKQTAQSAQLDLSRLAAGHNLPAERTAAWPPAQSSSSSAKQDEQRTIDKQTAQSAQLDLCGPAGLNFPAEGAAAWPPPQGSSSAHGHPAGVRVSPTRSSVDTGSSLRKGDPVKVPDTGAGISQPGAPPSSSSTDSGKSVSKSDSPNVSSTGSSAPSSSSDTRGTRQTPADARPKATAAMIAHDPSKAKKDSSYSGLLSENFKSYMQTDNLASIFSMVRPRGHKAPTAATQDNRAAYLAQRATLSSNADALLAGSPAPAHTKMDGARDQAKKAAEETPQPHNRLLQRNLSVSDGGPAGNDKAGLTDAQTLTRQKSQSAESVQKSPEPQTTVAAQRPDTRLATAGAAAKGSQREGMEDAELKEGDRVVVKVSQDSLEELQTRFGGTTKGMRQVG